MSNFGKRNVKSERPSTPSPAAGDAAAPVRRAPRNINATVGSMSGANPAFEASHDTTPMPATKACAPTCSVSTI